MNPSNPRWNQRFPKNAEKKCDYFLIFLNQPPNLELVTNNHGKKRIISMSAL